MPEIIVRGNLTVCQLVNSRSLYKLQLFGESLTSIVDASTFEFGRGANRPYGETLSGNTGASQDALLYSTQLLELHLDHLIQRLWDSRANIFKRQPEHPLPIGLCNQSLLHHILENGHHEQSVAAGVVVDQLGKSRRKVPLKELDGQVFGDIGLFKPFKRNFVT